MLVVVASCLIFGPKLDIQFKGGSMITYSYDGELPADFETKADSLLNSTVSVLQSTDIATQMKTVIVTLPGSQSLSSDEMLTFTQSLQEAYPSSNLHSLQINNVSPAVGKDFFAKAMVTMFFAFAMMLLYVTIRFRKIGGLSAGVTSVVALLHDVLMAFSVFVIFGIPINDNFIAVILTILGYSINGNIVIYDRIRENKRIMGSKATLEEIVDLSNNQSFTRTINISLAAIGALVVVAIVAYAYGVESIQSFAFPLIIGLLSGTYTSLCLASPLWVKWQERKLAAKAEA